MKNAILIILLVTIGYLGFRLLNQPAPVGQNQDSIFPQTQAGTTSVGFYLMDSDGQVLGAKNADVGFIPASALKTLTTATALDILGPDFQFTTEVRATSAFDQNGVINGDLVILGGGDPMLSLLDLKSWVVQLQSLGLKSISGNIIGDASFFDDSLAGEFWDWGDVGNGYGSPAAGLNLEHNRFRAIIQSGTTNASSASFFRAEPSVPGVKWDVKLTSSESINQESVMIFGGPLASTIQLRGKVPLNREISVTGAVPDPAIFTASVFHDLLKDAGVTITGEPKGSYAPIPADHLLLTHQSPPLIDIVRSIHRISDNHEAECVFKLMGKIKGDPVSVIHDHWADRVDLRSASRIVDGSGLSRANFITPQALTLIQHETAKGKHSKVYVDSLNATADGKVRLKAGAMSGIRTYTGYITANSGNTLTFALMYNHFNADDSSAIAENRDSVFSAIIESY